MNYIEYVSISSDEVFHYSWLDHSSISIIFSKENDKKCIIFTGGDAKYFVKRIKNTIFADCEPVIFGLNRILNYNAERI